MSLRNFDKWREIGASATVFNWLQQGVTLPFISETPSREFPNRQLTSVQQSFLDSEIDKLLSNNIIARCSTVPRVVSPLSLCCSKKGQK